VGLILLLLFFVKDLGQTAVLFSGLFIALSPAFSYYSRFYIQETLFVFFVTGFMVSFCRFRARPSAGWALAAGLFAGMMYCTKETVILVFMAVAGATALAIILQKKEEPAGARSSKTFPFGHLILGFSAAILVAAVFYSSFFKNPKGLVDSVLSFPIYFAKSAEPGFHAHPLLYYLGLLSYSKSGTLVWSEALILALAFFGVFASLRYHDHGRMFLLLYALLATIGFSIIPYKTPWNVLPFYIGWVLLAGMGAAFLMRAARTKAQKILVGALLAAGLFHLGWENYQANFRYFADPRNPYVYAQTSTDFLRLIRRVEEIAPLHPERERMLIKVVCGPYETWPLPWYLRKFERVGYWTDWLAAGELDGVPIIIASQDQAEKFESLLQNKFQMEYYGMRPDVLLTLFIRQDLWEQYIKQRES
jgi:uncharacterized protein (TIGR03663 family)